MTEDRTCRLCGEPGSKRRVQLTPWKTTCIFICHNCEPKMVEAILLARSIYESEMSSTG